MKRDLNVFWETGLKMFDAYGESGDSGDKLMESLDAAGEQMLACMKSIKQPILSDRRAAGQDYFKLLSATIFISVIMGDLVLIAALAVGVFMLLRILKPINTVKDRLQELASSQGDLTFSLHEGAKDEIGELVQCVHDEDPHYPGEC